MVNLVREISAQSTRERIVADLAKKNNWEVQEVQRRIDLTLAEYRRRGLDRDQFSTTYWMLANTMSHPYDSAMQQVDRIEEDLKRMMCSASRVYHT